MIPSSVNYVMSYTHDVRYDFNAYPKSRIVGTSVPDDVNAVSSRLNEFEFGVYVCPSMVKVPMFLMYARTSAYIKQSPSMLRTNNTFLTCPFSYSASYT